MHMILWIQRYRDISFLLLLVHECLIIVGGLYPIDYDEAMSIVVVHNLARSYEGIIRIIGNLM